MIAKPKGLNDEVIDRQGVFIRNFDISALNFSPGIQPYTF